jgi:hypothetical protein
MTYTTGYLINHTDYNTFATNIASVWGSGTGNVGLGQNTSSLTSVSSGQVATATQWTTLLSTVSNALTHQGDSPISHSAVTTGSVITPVTDLASKITTTSTNMGQYSGTPSSSSPVATTYTGAWGTTTKLVFTHSVTFSSGDAARYFFNSGGSLHFSLSHSGGTSSTGNTVWTTFFGNFISPTFGYAQYWNSSTSSTILSTQYNTATGHTGDYIQMSYYWSGTPSNSGYPTLNFTTILYDSSNSSMDGSYLVNDSVVSPPTIYINNSWGTPNITGSAVTQTVIFNYWGATLGGTADDAGYDLSHDSSGNIYVTGFTNSQDPGNSDLLLAKYSTAGSVQWQKILSGTAIWNPLDVVGIAVDSLDGIYVTGSTTSANGVGLGDMILAKFDVSGNLLWQQALGDVYTDTGMGVTCDSFNNVYITGYTGGYDIHKLVLAKYNSSGALQWQGTLADSVTSNYIAGVRVTCDSSSNVFVTGYSESTTYQVYSQLVAKFNSSGALQWQKTLTSAGNTVGQGIVCDISGNVYVSGYANNGHNMATLIKIDTSGNLIWQKALTNSNDVAAGGVTMDSSGYVYIVGADLASSGLMISKFDSSGNIQWNRNMAGATMWDNSGIQCDSSGNMYISCAATFGAGSKDLLLLKLPTDGSALGSYGNLTYSIGTETVSNAGLTMTTATWTSATSTLTQTTTTLSTVSTTLTSTFVGI